MKAFLANTIVHWFKRIPFAGRFRFKCLYWAYRITGWHIRHREWDFVLDYLPKLDKWQNVSVLDVGCAKSLFCHEVIARGYELIGLDLDKPSFKYPGKFYQGNIVKFRLTKGVDFITCISVFEHVERKEQQRALYDMMVNLKLGGRLILTIPTHEFAQGHPWNGFNSNDLNKLLPEDFHGVLEYTERAGQICCSIERIQ